MNNGYRAVLLCSLVVLFSACSGVEEKRHAYKQSESLAPLKLPQGITLPHGSENLAVPEVDRSALGGEPFVTRPPIDLPPQVNEPQESE